MSLEEDSRSHPTEDAVTDNIDLQEKLSRRRFLEGSAKLGAGIVLTSGLAVAIAHLPTHNQEVTSYLSRDEYELQEALKRYPSPYMKRHNASNYDRRDPDKLTRSLEGLADEIEIDAINFYGEPYVAHSVREFEDDLEDNPSLLETQRLDTVLKRTVNSGKGIALDSKIDKDDKDGFEILLARINNLVPEDTRITFSGKDWESIFKIRRPNSSLTATVEKIWQIPKYQHAAEQALSEVDSDQIFIGATIDDRLPNENFHQLIQYNKDRGFGNYIYTVNNTRRIIELIRLGVTGITTDEDDLITKVNFQHAA